MRDPPPEDDHYDLGRTFFYLPHVSVYVHSSVCSVCHRFLLTIARPRVCSLYSMFRYNYTLDPMSGFHVLFFDLLFPLPLLLL
jgi:hypothetical protein